MKIKLEVWSPDGLQDFEIEKELKLTEAQVRGIHEGDQRVIRKVAMKEIKAYTKFSNVKEFGYNSTFKCATAEQGDLLARVKFVDIAPKEVIYG